MAFRLASLLGIEMRLTTFSDVTRVVGDVMTKVSFIEIPSLRYVYNNLPRSATTVKG